MVEENNTAFLFLHTANVWMGIRLVGMPNPKPMSVDHEKQIVNAEIFFFSVDPALNKLKKRLPIVFII